MNYFSIICCLFLSVQTLEAQFSLEGEIQTYYYEKNPSVTYQIDTSLQNFEAYNYENTDDWEYFNTSIFGTAQQKLSFERSSKKGFQDGNIFFNNYKYDIDRIKYYNTQKFPYSELSYLIGQRLEQKVGLQHAQNVKNRFRFAIDAKGMSASGIYSLNQRVRNFGISFYGIYSSKNDRYHLETDIVYVSIKANEIGGIQPDVLTGDAVPNKLFYNDSTWISEAIAKQSTLSLALKNKYDFGFVKLDSINDTLNVNRFYPVFRLSHSIGTNIVKQGFVDYLSKTSNDSLFYTNLGFFQNIDSTVYNLQYHNIPHRFSFEYLGTKPKGDSAQYINLKAAAAIQHNNIEVWQNGFEKTYNNLMLEATIQSNEKANSNLKYNLNSSFFLTGYNQFDFNVTANAKYKLGKFGAIGAHFVYETISPTWIENFYTSEGISWENNFKKKQILETGFSYFLPSQKLRVNFQADFLKDHIYFDAASTPLQTDASIVYWNVSLQKDTKWKIWHWNNFIGYQFTNHREILQVPALFLKTSLYAEFNLFKKNMLMSAGFDIRFNTAFNARAWNPVISQFYVQETRTMKYTPVADIFIAMKIKSLRFYAKLNYANEGLFKRNNYKALNYPSNGRTFSIGLSWRFFE